MKVFLYNTVHVASSHCHYQQLYILNPKGYLQHLVSFITKEGKAKRSVIGPNTIIALDNDSTPESISFQT